MNTVQKYAGKGNSAQNPSQTVETRRFTPLTPDERAELVQQLSNMQGELLDLVDSITSIQDRTDPVTLIADLLQDLLSRPAEELASDYSREKFRTGLQLIAFLSEVRQWLSRREVIADALEAGKEVSNG